VAGSLGVFVPHPHKHVNPHEAVQARLGFQDRLALIIGIEGDRSPSAAS